MRAVENAARVCILEDELHQKHAPVGCCNQEVSDLRREMVMVMSCRRVGMCRIRDIVEVPLVDMSPALG